MKSKRLLHVMYSFSIGGSEMVARDIALGLDDWIHGAVALGPGGPLEAELNQAGVLTWAVRADQPSPLRTVTRLRRVIREFRPDVVHSHHLYGLTYACLGSLFSGVRLVHTEHEYYSLMGAKARRRIKRLSRFCQAVTAVNEETAAFLTDEAGVARELVSVIRNGVDVDLYRRAGIAREQLQLADSDQVIGIVGRLEPVKGHGILLEAFAEVRKSAPYVKLLIVGDGSERARLEAKASDLGLADDVRFVGPRRDIPDLLHAMDVFVVSSLEEGLPMSLLEAMAAARPVVATAVGSIPGVVRNGETGLLVPPDDKTALAAALDALLRDQNLRNRLAANALQLAGEEYSLRASLAKYREVYNGFGLTK